MSAGRDISKRQVRAWRRCRTCQEAAQRFSKHVLLVNPAVKVSVIVLDVQEEAQQLEKNAQELRAAQEAFTARTAAVEADLSAREAAVAAAQGGHAQVCCN